MKLAIDDKWNVFRKFGARERQPGRRGLYLLFSLISLAGLFVFTDGLVSDEVPLGTLPTVGKWIGIVFSALALGVLGAELRRERREGCLNLFTLLYGLGNVALIVLLLFDFFLA